jgi:hypothetical protein
MPGECFVIEESCSAMAVIIFSRAEQNRNREIAQDARVVADRRARTDDAQERDYSVGSYAALGAVRYLLE